MVHERTCGRIYWSWNNTFMSRIFLFLLLLVLALAQYTILPRFAPLGVTPDIVLVVLFYRFLRCSTQESLFWVFIIGIVLDVLALDPLGAHALAMVPMVMAAQPLRVRPWLVNPISCGALLLASALFYCLFLSLVRGGVSLMDVAVQLLYVIVLAPVGYWVYRRFYKR